LAVGLVSACGKKASGGESASGGEAAIGGESTVAITGIDLGRSVKSDLTINDATDSFSPTDVIYVSVGTKGAGPGTIRARWVFGENQQIADDSRTITVNGPEHTEFHMSNPNGLPKGEYRVEITLNGVAAGHEGFRVN
jgi:hypothetical protein